MFRREVRVSARTDSSSPSERAVHKCETTSRTLSFSYFDISISKNPIREVRIETTSSHPSSSSLRIETRDASSYLSVFQRQKREKSEVRVLNVWRHLVNAGS